MKIRNAILKNAVAAALVLSSTTGFALDLIGSYERARGFDPTKLAANEAVLAGREKKLQGSALLLPQVTLSAGYSHVKDRTSLDLPPPIANLIKGDSSGSVRQAALQISQPIYNAKASADKKQLHEQSELAEINYRGAVEDLIRRVAEAYFNVLLAQESLRVTQAEKAAVQNQRDRAQARFDVGRGRITELQETQARYDTVLAREVSAESKLALQQAQYFEVTGAPALGLAELRTDFRPMPPQPGDLATWQAKGMERNTRVLIKHGELQIAGAEIDKYKLSGRPTLELVASHSTKGQNGSLSPTVAPNDSRVSTIGLQLSIPLFNGGALNSRERESIAKKRQAEQELGAARRDARLQVQDAYLTVTTGVARIGALEQSVLSAQTALDATTLGRDLGTRTELDVLDAQQRLFAAQLDLAQARNDYLMGRIRLASAAGELGDEDLRALNAYLVH